MLLTGSVILLRDAHPQHVAEVKLVIFDCDGVLVDSESISNSVLARLLTAEGLPTTLAEARRDYQGLLLSDVVSSAQLRLPRRLPDDWLETYERERTEAFRRELQPVQGAAEVVELLSAAGIGVCVASQGKLEKTRLSLELTGLSHLFGAEAVFSAEEVARGKPHPHLFLHAAAVMGASPHECVVVEDTPSGVIAAVCAGMRVFGYIGDSDRSALIRAGAQELSSLRELPALIGLD
jgi:HAD superfamily hydrolase (TIGR01509 family)